MKMIATDQWLKKYVAHRSGIQDTDFNLQRNFLCKPLKCFFPNASLNEIHWHLIQNGLFLPSASDKDRIGRLYNGSYWDIAEKEIEQLKQKWSGPEVPVFILPANLDHEQLRNDFNGRSGLAHHDKFFLFISGEISEGSFRALVTHEYNHVCRLHALNKQEHELTLLDVMVMEGIAEAAVAEQVGKEHLTPWAAIYSRTDAASFWKMCARPYKHIKKSNMRHQLLMYGNDQIPKWLGYNIGFHIVKSFIENTNTAMQSLLHLPAEDIFSGSFLREN